MSATQYYYNRSNGNLCKINSDGNSEPVSAQPISISINKTGDNTNPNNIFNDERPLIILDQNNVPVKIKVENVGNQSYTIVTDPTN